MEGTGLRPFFCRIGSKRPIADKVIDAFPDDKNITTYVEPFIGGGAILWTKTPHPKEVINDLDTQLIKDYRLLKSTKARNFRNDLNTVPAIQSFVDKNGKGEANELTYGIVSRCNRWAGKTTGKIYSDSNPINKLKNIEEYQERLKNVTISNTSYEKVIKKYDGPNTFFYCDPPYEASDSSGDLYGKHSEFSQEALRDTLAKVKGKWLLSINDSPTIRKLYKGYYYKAFTIKKKGKEGGPLQSIGGRDRKELLLANYKF
jgi:DNA adenine methylase